MIPTIPTATTVLFLYSKFSLTSSLVPEEEHLRHDAGRGEEEYGTQQLSVLQSDSPLSPSGRKKKWF